MRRGARLEAEPRAGGGGSGDGDGDDGHQVGVAGPGRAGQLDRARGIDGEDEAPVGQRPGQAGGGGGVLAAGGMGGQDVPHRLAQAQQGGVLGVAQPGLGGQQSRRAEPVGCLLLGTELGVLVLFSVVALVKVYAGSIHGSVEPSLSWVTPTDFGGASALTEGLLAAVFIYWGWDTATSVNEECEDANTTPGVAGVLSTIILVLIFVIVAIAAQSVKGAEVACSAPWRSSS